MKAAGRKENACDKILTSKLKWRVYEYFFSYNKNLQKTPAKRKKSLEI